jgi:ribosomal protein L13E
MSNLLYPLQREIELKNPENRRIVRVFRNAEFERMNKAVYSSLEKKYPSLIGRLRDERRDSDHIENLEKNKSRIRNMGNFKQLAQFINAIGENENTQAIVSRFENMDPTLELFGKYLEVQEQLYVDLARALKQVSAQREVSVESLVGELQYRDEVSRVVVPTREEAELFLSTSETCERNFYEASRGMIGLVKKLGFADRKFLEKAKLLPTAEAIGELHESTRSYKMLEFDRVYPAE